MKKIKWNLIRKKVIIRKRRKKKKVMMKKNQVILLLTRKYYWIFFRKSYFLGRVEKNKKSIKKRVKEERETQKEKRRKNSAIKGGRRIKGENSLVRSKYSQMRRFLGHKWYEAFSYFSLAKRIHFLMHNQKGQRRPSIILSKVSYELFSILMNLKKY